MEESIIWHKKLVCYEATGYKVIKCCLTSLPWLTVFVRRSRAEVYLRILPMNPNRVKHGFLQLVLCTENAINVLFSYLIYFVWKGNFRAN